MFGSETDEKIEALERSVKWANERIEDEREKRWECEKKLDTLMRHLKLKFEDVERHWGISKLP